MTDPHDLPEGFGDLAPFVPLWSLAGSDARKRRRIASTEHERQAFYAAAAPRLADALAHLDRLPLGDLAGADRNLMNLVLSLAHVSLAVEKQGSNEARHAVNHAFFTITRSTEDYPA
jgi:hypothetical protein